MLLFAELLLYLADLMKRENDVWDVFGRKCLFSFEAFSAVLQMLMAFRINSFNYTNSLFICWKPLNRGLIG